MSDTPKPELGHMHDLDPAEVAAFHMTILRQASSVSAAAGEQKKTHLVSGTGVLLFGVDGDQIALGLTTKRSSAMDPNVWMEGAKLGIPQAEHIIRALITLVAQAKKNAIDKPSPFGHQYTGLPLTKTEGE